jgi:mono/diheme cytochrome c family protein
MRSTIRGTGRKNSRILILAGLAVVLGFAAYLVLAAEPESESLARPETGTAAPLAEKGAVAFAGGGFGGISQTSLETNAVPFKLVATALVMDEQLRDPMAPADLATLQRVMRRFGFLYPERVDGAPVGMRLPIAEKPLGMTHGFIAPIGGARVEVANLGCAACHAGVAYAADGNPQPGRVVLGMPNTSLDLESYTQAIFTALRRHANDPALLAMADTLFPEMSWQERASLRWIVLPLARGRLETLAGAARALPFPNGLPGATNGVAALKFQMGTPLMGGGPGDRGFVSIPDLGLRHHRSRLLVDGAYATPSGQTDAHELAVITSFFTVPSMGVTPEMARRHIPEAEAIFAWLTDYRPQAYPGPIDQAAAEQGAALYARGCASCHGSFDWNAGVPRLATYPDWIGDVGTDPLRAQAVDSALAEAIGKSAYGRAISVANGQGYAAPPLAGVWASAPYLHNGSVPSLAALLDPPLRPARFMVGGHALDWQTMGLRLTPEGRYPSDYTPFSEPQWIDTAQPGLGNGGHIYGSELTAQERQALIAFLKLL